MSGTPTRTRRSPRWFTARQKCEAVLSIWMENRKPSEVCRELEINWATLSQWQDRAMEGMLQALAPPVAREEPAQWRLKPKLQGLLERKSHQIEARALNLDRKLKSLQKETAEPTPAARTAGRARKAPSGPSGTDS